LPVVEVLAAGPEQEPVLANLLELYSYDFSELLDLRLGPDGRFGYPRLPLYWHEEGRYPFLVHVDGELAGFALVTKGSVISGDADSWDMAEFFIVRRYRRRGIGAAVARRLWQRFPGPWEIRVHEKNEPAYGFWRAAVQAFAHSSAQERSVTLQEKRWNVFSFVSLSARNAAQEKKIHFNHEAHLQDFVRLNELWITEHFKLEEADVALAQNPGKVIANGGVVFSLTVDDRVVGVCALFKEGDARYQLARMAVDPEHRGKGYGNTLMEHALAKAKELGATSVFLLSNTVLQSAIELYKKFGFGTVSTGQHPVYARCNIVMERSV
jgi:predicted acetyltransferase/N-acetylglutamate synthase-like GNAT family acetyltransferase